MHTKTCLIRFCTLLFITTLLLAGCASIRQGDRPDQYKQSPRSSATQRPYVVNGTRYEPISSSEGFSEEGLASSYGSEFHGRKTSNGETFDMNDMTAAHKTLPMGVYVRVKLLRNGNEVVVRINDRGPFVRNRIIDLSTAAAEKLGMLKEGITPVRITALGYRSGGSQAAPSYRTASYDSGSFTIQVGAFTVRGNAYRHVEELKRRYGSADVQEAVVKGTQFYRVRVARYNSLKAARRGQDQFEKNGFKGCFVVAD